jgi:prepilin peptidase CpaA
MPPQPEHIPTEAATPPMTSYLHYVAITGFSLLMAIAAFEDFRRFVIPNLLTVALCLLWPVYFISNPSLSGALWSFGCAAAVFVVGAVLFARGYLGGGDVKLLSAAALWAGPGGTPGLLLLTGILGGALALLLLMPLGAQIAAMARAALSPKPATTEPRFANPVPYGVAIAAAAVITILSPNLH